MSTRLAVSATRQKLSWIKRRTRELQRGHRHQGVTRRACLEFAVDLHCSFTGERVVRNFQLIQGGLSNGQ